MAQSSPSGHGSTPSPSITEVIGRALTDDHFREQLYTHRDQALRGYHLTEADMAALESLPRQTLEEHVQRFARGSAAGLAIGIVIRGHFNTP